MADNCGTPTPATIRVVQILPGTNAHFHPVGAGIHQCFGAFAGSHVAADDLKVGVQLFQRFYGLQHPREWPWAVSTHTTSTPALTSASTRSIMSVVTPTAAPTTRRPSVSLQALGMIVPS
jgi:hypothetical protein